MSMTSYPRAPRMQGTNIAAVKLWNLGRRERENPRDGERENIREGKYGSDKTREPTGAHPGTYKAIRSGRKSTNDKRRQEYTSSRVDPASANPTWSSSLKSGSLSIVVLNDISCSENLRRTSTIPVRICSGQSFNLQPCVDTSVLP